jgi:hypothetical protein
MRGNGEARRLFFAILFALIAGFLVAYINPMNRIKADLRADAKGLVISLEYSAKFVEG